MVLETQKKRKFVFTEKHMKYVLLIFLLVLVTAFYMLYFNNTFPITDGWGVYYVELLKTGKIPYKDFYYYLPPLNLCIDYVMWQCSFGYLIVYRLYRLIERLLMLTLIYLLLSRFFKCKYAFIATLLSAILGVADVYDLIGDYNQTGELLIVIVTLFVVNYVTANSVRKKYLNAALVGAFLGLLLMLKQSSAAAALIVFMLFFVIYSLQTKNRKWYLDSLYVGLGFLIAIAPFMIYILTQGAFENFIFQVFIGGSNSKGGLFTIFIQSITDRIFSKFFLVVVLLIMLWAGVHFLTTKNFNKKLKIVGWVIWGVVAAGFGIHIFYRYFYNVINQSGLMGLRDTVSVLTSFVMILLFMGLICWYIYNVKHFDIKHFIYLALFTGAFASCYTAAMTCGTSSMPVRTLFFSLPVILTIILGWGNGISKFVKNSLVVCLCLVLCLSVFQNKFVNAYSWWGWTEASFSVKTKTTNIKALKGVRLSEEQRDLYETVCKLINENTDKNAIVYGFPHVKIFNILTNRIGENGFVPVPFYDVSDGEYVAKDAELLSQNNPDIVIWCDIPWCLETHETAFNGGKMLGHREIFKWFKIASEQDYTLIGQVGNLFVYLKNTHTPVYIDIRNDDAINSSLENFTI